MPSRDSSLLPILTDAFWLFVLACLGYAFVKLGFDWADAETLRLIGVGSLLVSLLVNADE
ncbi:hypothetical protein [Methylobacterium sp. 1030]|uniref:hypothetical protein n=1 Tax=Methylobacterium sp. 1030 TaxID=3156404 RepID=UPI0033938744